MLAPATYPTRGERAPHCPSGSQHLRPAFGLLCSLSALQWALAHLHSCADCARGCQCKRRINTAGSFSVGWGCLPPACPEGSCQCQALPTSLFASRPDEWVDNQPLISERKREIHLERLGGGGSCTKKAAAQEESFWQLPGAEPVGLSATAGSKRRGTTTRLCRVFHSEK